MAAQSTSKNLGNYLKDAGFFGLAQQFLKLSSLITLPIITKKLGVDQYGVLALTNTLSGFIIWFILWSFPSATVRFLAGETHHKVIAQVHYTALIFIVVSGSIWFLISLPSLDFLAIRVFQDIQYKRLIQLAILSATFSAITNLLMVTYRIREENRHYIQIDVIFSLLTTAVTIAVLLWVDNVIPVVLAVVCLKFVRNIYLFVSFVRFYGWVPSSLSVFQPYLRFSLPLLIPQIMSWVLTLSDRFIIGLYYTPTQVGIYSASYNLAILVNHIILALFFTFTPVFARLWNNKEYDKLRLYFKNTSNLLIGLGIPMTVGMSMLCDPILTLLATSEVGNASIQVIPFVALSYILFGLGGYGTEIFLYHKKSSTTGIFAALAAIINLGLNFWLIPHWGVLGAAISTLIAYTIQTTLLLTYGKRLFAFSFDLKFMRSVFVATIGMGLLIWSLPLPSPWHALWHVPVGVITYSTILYIITGCPSKAQLRTYLQA